MFLSCLTIFFNDTNWYQPGAPPGFFPTVCSALQSHLKCGSFNTFSTLLLKANMFGHILASMWRRLWYQLDTTQLSFLALYFYIFCHQETLYSENSKSVKKQIFSSSEGFKMTWENAFLASWKQRCLLEEDPHNRWFILVVVQVMQQSLYEKTVITKLLFIIKQFRFYVSEILKTWKVFLSFWRKSCYLCNYDFQKLYFYFISIIGYKITNIKNWN